MGFRDALKCQACVIIFFFARDKRSSLDQQKLEIGAGINFLQIYYHFSWMCLGMLD